ncbi:MAG: ATP-dependent zinc metalloprotease FtsH, partial [Oscillospiraceae bacterium]
GFTMYRPEEDVQFRTKTQMKENIVSMLGGRVAEKLVLDDISTGASNDLERATGLARSMVTRYGFSERLGPVVYDTDPGETFLGRDFSSGRHYSEEVASQIDSEIREMMDEAFEAAKNILEEHMDQLHLISKTLLEREKISGDDFRILMEGGTLPPMESTAAPAGKPAEKEAPAVKENANPVFENAGGSTVGSGFSNDINPAENPFNSKPTE